MHFLKRSKKLTIIMKSQTPETDAKSSQRWSDLASWLMTLKHIFSLTWGIELWDWGVWEMEKGGICGARCMRLCFPMLRLYHCATKNALSFLSLFMSSQSPSPFAVCARTWADISVFSLCNRRLVFPFSRTRTKSRWKPPTLKRIKWTN